MSRLEVVLIVGYMMFIGLFGFGVGFVVANLNCQAEKLKVYQPDIRRAT